MAIVLELNTTLIFDTVEDAHKHGLALETVLGSPNGIKLRDTKGFIRSEKDGDVYGQKAIPLHDPTFKPAGLTYRKQEMEVLAGSMVNKFVVKFDADASIFSNQIKLDATGRTWEVDYRGMIESIKLAYPENYTEQLATFQGIIQEVLTQSAIGKISFK